MARLTALDIEKLLIDERHKGPQWECIRELRLGCGYGCGRERSIDLWCIECCNTNNCQAIAYEIKVSKSDFRADLKIPDKQRGALVFSNYFYYVAPAGIIPHDEVPKWAGLIEVNIPTAFNVNDKKCNVAIKSYRRDKMAPSWSLVASIIRRTK